MRIWRIRIREGQKMRIRILTPEKNSDWSRSLFCLVDRGVVIVGPRRPHPPPSRLMGVPLVGVTNPVFDTFPIDIWPDGNCQKLGWFA